MRRQTRTLLAACGLALGLALAAVPVAALAEGAVDTETATGTEVPSSEDDYGIEFRAGVFTSYAGFVGNQLVPSDEPGVDYELTFDDSVTEKDFEELSEKLGTEVTAPGDGIIDLQANLEGAPNVRDYFDAGAAYSTNDDVVAVDNSTFSGFSQWVDLLATGHGTADVWVTYAYHLDDGDDEIDGYLNKVIRVTVPDSYELHEDEYGIADYTPPVTIKGLEPQEGEKVTYVATDATGKLTASMRGGSSGTFEWESTNPSVMTVDQDGTFKARGKAGNVVIRVRNVETNEKGYQLVSVGDQTMYRLYNQWTGEHFYTADAAEFDSLKKAGWTDEGEGWVAPTAGKEVYRLYNPYVEGGDHHYTLDVNEYNALKEFGWEQEGVGWHSGGSVPVYRQYNPYATTGTHNYTTSKNENDTLVGLGWKAEGIGWYGLA